MTKFMTFLLVSTVLVCGAVYAGGWEAIARNLGGVPVAADQQGHPCYWFEKDQQLMCYSVFKTWYGATDAVPVYVIDHGVRTELFNDR